MLNTVFEKQACTRCGGRGEYSYCQTHGRRCFQCGGKGETLTKRGAAAAKFYVDSCMIRTDEVQIGDTIQTGSVTGSGAAYSFFIVVTKIDPLHRIGQSKIANGDWIDSYGITIHGENAKYGKSAKTAAPDTMVRKGQTSDQKAAKYEAALNYQATLTKTGTPRKRAA